MFELFRRHPKPPIDKAAADAQKDVKRKVLEALRSGTTEPDLSGGSVFDLKELPSEIGELHHLRTLKMINGGLETVAPLSRLSHLEALDLDHSWNLSEISPLSELTNLRTLNLSESKVVEIQPLSTLTRLQVLYLQKCGLSDLTPLSGLTLLEHLDLSNTKVTDLSAIAGLSSLKSLNLWNTHITDLTPLSCLTGLKRLDLWNTQIKDLSPLEGLTGLTHLDLSHTPIEDLTPIGGLPNLEYLALWNTPFQAEGIAVGQYQGRWYDGEINQVAADGDIKAVKARVASGAMIMNDQWDGPIHWAVRNGREEVCRYLVALEPSIVNEPACYDGVYEAETPLSLAISHHQPKIEFFLRRHGAKITSEEDN